MAEQKSCSWTCIVVTCINAEWAAAIDREFQILKKKHQCLASIPVLTIEDPAQKMGSGAATLNALVIATEFLSAKRGYSVLTADVLCDSHILILHHGRHYPYDPCGKAFLNLPSEKSPIGITTNLENLLMYIDRFCQSSPPGVWVCSTDMLLTGELGNDFMWTDPCDALLFCVPANVEYAVNHGSVRISSEGVVQDIIYCGTPAMVSSCFMGDGLIPIVTGIVYLSVALSESLLSFHALSPLDSCTYLGLDSGTDPIQVSLYFDILIALASDVSKEAFLLGKCGKFYNQKFGYNEDKMAVAKKARGIVWDHLSKYTLKAAVLKGVSHSYWAEQMPCSQHAMNLLKTRPLNNSLIHSFIISHVPLLQDALLINTLLECEENCIVDKETIVNNSQISAKSINIGKHCFINGVFEAFQDNFVVQNNLVVLNFIINHTGCEAVQQRVKIPVVFGIHDQLVVPISQDSSTFCGKPWTAFFESARLNPEDVWPSNLEANQRNLLNAKLYSPEMSVQELLSFCSGNRDPCVVERWKQKQHMSLLEILDCMNIKEQFETRRKLHASITSLIIKDGVRDGCSKSFLPYFETACAEGWGHDLLDALDEACITNAENTVVVSRSLSCIADLLGMMAGTEGGVRSGPGGNKSWARAFELLESGDIIEGVKALSRERKHWLDRPDHMMRAARHYEGALQVLIRSAVASAKKFISLSQSVLPEMETWVIAEAPARIDLQGGWTDTPPICFEHGGCVVNMAVLLNGKKPIGAKVKRIKEPEIVLYLEGESLQCSITLNDMADILDYKNPAAQGALLKAAIITTELVDLSSPLSLRNQLSEKYGGGFEVHAWSNVPKGSGLGTSSILAGCVIAALWTASGKAYDKKSILHAVLYLEQLLTTGGGWQDQVGGLMGGINLGYSLPQLPLHIQVEPIKLEEAFLTQLQRRLLLIYTGKVRLAKNLLQAVIRNWYAREENVVCCFRELKENAYSLKSAFTSGDIKRIGHHMNAYWEQKKVLASGCEPAAVRELMDALWPHVYGQHLVGAGGGGFMCVLTKEQDAASIVQHHIQSISSISGSAEIYSVSISSSGITVQVRDKMLNL